VPDTTKLPSIITVPVASVIFAALLILFVIVKLSLRLFTAGIMDILVHCIYAPYRFEESNKKPAEAG
jgi:hypothetical protein